MLSFQELMNNVNSAYVRKIIELLRKHHGSTLKPASLREIEKIYGLGRGNLDNWMKATPERSKLFDFIEAARKDLELSDETAYKLTIKNKKS